MTRPARRGRGQGARGAREGLPPRTARCCGRHASSWERPRSRPMARLLRHARRREGGLRGGDQEGLPQARAQVAPGRATPATSRPRSASRRSRRRTRCCPTPRSASSTTPGGHVRRRRRLPLRPVGVPQGGVGSFGDILSDLFGRGGGGGAAAQRGRDLETEVRLSFAQAINGTQVSVSVPVEAPCPTCHGSGAKPGHRRRGPVPAARAAASRREGQGMFSISQPCSRVRRPRHRDRRPVPDLRRRGADRTR